MTDAKPGKIERIYNSVVFFFAAAFFGYLVFSIFFPMTGKGSGARSLKLLAAALLGLAAIMLATWFVNRHLDARTCDTAVVFLVAINLVLQVICIVNLRVSPSWDFGSIMSAAEDISKGRAIRYIAYYSEYPYNLNTAVLVGTFKYLAGGSVWAPYLLNVAAITSSVAGACLAARKTLGHVASVLTGVFCTAATPLYLYAPIVYTDTLSMPFSIWTIYLWTLTKPHAGRRKLLALYAGIGVLSAVGYLIKPIAAIGLIAIVLECLFGLAPGKGSKLFLRTLSVTAAIAAALITVASAHYYIDFKGYTSRLDYNKTFPFTHWLMMGMNGPISEGGSSSGYGGFSAYDLTFTRSYPTKQQKMEANMLVMKERLKNYGFKGYAQFLLKKAEWTWTDGTYYAPIKLARRPIRFTRLSIFVLPNEGLSHRLYTVFTKVTQLLLLALILCGCIYGLIGRNSRLLRPMAVMCLGIMVFLLFWESRSRYLVTMIPVFIVMAAAGANASFLSISGLPLLSGQFWKRMPSKPK